MPVPVCKVIVGASRYRRVCTGTVCVIAALRTTASLLPSGSTTTP